MMDRKTRILPAAYAVDRLQPAVALGTDSGTQPGITQGRDLQFSEILRLPLNGDLVSLSACQSALGRLVTAEGLMGPTRAFSRCGSGHDRHAVERRRNS